jgi:hypothetical protein
VGRGRRGWLTRGVLAAVLLVVAFAPSQASGSRLADCTPVRCDGAGTVRWAEPLPGSWTAATDALGTVPAAESDSGQAYAAAGQSVVAIGFGMTVYGYSARNGAALWATGLSGFPDGSQIVSVRVWPGVVTVGVARGPLLGVGGQSQSTVVLTASGGQQARVYPAAPFGGAVSADTQRTVVVGPGTVTSYANATGRVLWRRFIGSTAQDWRSDGGHIYVTEAAGGYLGSGPVTALRRISLHNGAEQVIHPAGGSFAGRLSAVLRGVVLFSGGQGVSAYSASTGQFLWQLAGAIPEGVDEVQGLFYLTVGSTLAGVSPLTGRVRTRVTGAEGSVSGVYGVRDGVALGLDEGALGAVWGYDVASQHVIWTTRTLPWPHYFTDLSGIGGSADPGSDAVVLTACAQRVQTPAGPACQSPELVLVDR